MFYWKYGTVIHVERLKTELSTEKQQNPALSMRVVAHMLVPKFPWGAVVTWFLMFF
jgi:hypothetical protein